MVEAERGNPKKKEKEKSL